MTAAYDQQSSKAFTLSDSFTHTPVGTPMGIWIPVAQITATTNVISAVTYGGVTVPIDPNNGFVADATGELGGVYSFFLGSGIPTGAQTVAVTTANGDAKRAWCVSLTAGADTQIAASNKTSGDAANPSVVIPTLASFVGFAGAVLFSGQNAPASVTAGSGYTLLTATEDFGITSGLAERSDTRAGANIAAGFTATTEDVALIGIAVNEVVATFQPRQPASNFQDPALFMRAWRGASWRRRRSGIVVPDLRISTA